MNGDVEVETPARPRIEPLDVVRVLLAAGWLVVAVALLTVGERSSTVDDLAKQIVDGHVHEVSVSDGLAPGSKGTVTQQVRWSSGLIHYSAEVVQRSAGDQVEAGHRDGVPVIHEDFAQLLSDRFPDVTVSREAYRYPSGEVAGWYVPRWVGLSVVVLFLLTIGLVCSGPQPRRVTRWGWFWLVTMAAPVGVPAYLLLGRPGEVEPGGSGRDTRMGGLAAFVLALFVVPACTALLALAY